MKYHPNCFIKELWPEVESVELEKVCSNILQYPNRIIEIQGVDHSYGELAEYLKSHKWFTDTLINQYLHLFQSQNRREDNWICSSFEFEAMQRTHNREHLIDKFCSFHKLLIPVNFQNKHWLCIELYPHCRRVNIYDSLYDHNDFLFKVLNEFWASVKSHKGWKTDLKITWYNKTPKQVDSSSCGLHCISNIKSMHLGLPMLEISDELEHIRRYIIYTILKNDLNKNT